MPGNPTEGQTLVFTCAGAAHTGQGASRAGVQLRQDMSGTLFCAAAETAVDLRGRITGLGIEKQPAQPSLIADTKKVVDHVHSQLDS
jgi:uncharacterized metal-binding protein